MGVGTNITPLCLLHQNRRPAVAAEHLRFFRFPRFSPFPFSLSPVGLSMSADGQKRPCLSRQHQG